MSPVHARIQVMDDENCPASSNGVTFTMPRSNLKDDKSNGENEEEVVVILEAETAAQKEQRDIAASEDLARRLMAEEAIESYRVSASLLQANASDYSKEDLAVIQAAMGYGASGVYDNDNNYNDGDDDEYHEESISSSSDIMSYDALLRLGEHIGDVKSERWAMRAEKEIAKLPIVRFDENFVMDENETKRKCLICQLNYEPKDQLRYLPCDHTFHRDCADHWLMVKDCCPYCRQNITSSDVTN